MKSNDKIHIEYIDGFRAVTCMYVVIHHMFLQIIVSNDFHAITKILLSFFSQGRYAVDIFIVISGYCLMLSYLKSRDNKINLIKYYYKRAKRILPAYYSSVFFSLILIYTLIGNKTGTNWDASIPVSIWDIICHILLIQDVFLETPYKINHVLWTIAVEWRIYMFFPLIIICWNKLGIYKTLFLGLMLSIFSWYALAYIGLNFYTMSPQYLSLFTFGMFAITNKYHVDKLLGIMWSKVILIITLIVFILIVLLTNYQLIRLPVFISDISVGLLAMSLIINIDNKLITISRAILENYLLVFIGTFSYSIYLIHAPILQLLSKFVLIPLKYNSEISLYVFVFGGLPLVLLFSYLFYLISEKPLLKKI